MEVEQKKYCMYEYKGYDEGSELCVGEKCLTCVDGQWRSEEIAEHDRRNTESHQNFKKNV